MFHGKHSKNHSLSLIIFVRHFFPIFLSYISTLWFMHDVSCETGFRNKKTGPFNGPVKTLIQTYFQELSIS